MFTCLNRHLAVNIAQFGMKSKGLHGDSSRDSGVEM